MTKSASDSGRSIHLWRLYNDLYSHNFEMWQDFVAKGRDWRTTVLSTDPHRRESLSSGYEEICLPIGLIGLLLSWDKTLYRSSYLSVWVRSEDLDLLEAFLEGLT